MQYRTLGRTGLKVSEIGLGGEWFNGLTAEESTAIVDTAQQSGINYIDIFMPQAPTRSNLGIALKGRREAFIIQGHLCTVFEDGQYTRTRDIEKTKRSFADLLERLQTDYIDGYLMHWDDRVGTPIEETIACMKELKNAGKVRFLGMSNLERDLADRLLADGVLDIVQYPYNMINRTKEDVLKYYAGQGCGTMGYGSLGGGILTGQFREVPTFGHGDMRASFYGPMFTEPGFSQIQTLLKVMDGIAETHKATVAQVAINWALAHDYMHTVLTGVGNAAEAEENCAAAAWELTVQEKQELDEAISKIHIYS